MLRYLISKTEKLSRKFFRPRVVVGVPSGITNVEMRAVYDATKEAGAREVYLVEEPMASAIGIRLPVKDPVGSMVIDIGGGTVDIAVISLGGIVQSKNLKIAGDKLNQDVMSYMRDEFKLLIGEKTAESIKMAVGTAQAGPEPLETHVKGRDLITGLPREIIVTDADIREAISNSIMILVDSVKEVLQKTPPEILGDVMKRGVHVSGGGALIRGLKDLLHESLRIPVYIADDPLSCVARGCGIILDDLEAYEDVLVRDNSELSSRK